MQDNNYNITYFSIYNSYKGYFKEFIFNLAFHLQTVQGYMYVKTLRNYLKIVFVTSMMIPIKFNNTL